MTTAAPSPLAVAERLFAAIERGDVDAVGALYAPDVAVWHNYDNVAQTRDQNLRTLAWMVRNVASLRYEEVRRKPVSGGVLQQHVLRGVAPNGAQLEIPSCMLISVVDGRITRIEEYLDSAQFAALRA
jgi:ketosteroid isomerase-like protein